MGATWGCLRAEYGLVGAWRWLVTAITNSLLSDVV